MQEEKVHKRKGLRAICFAILEVEEGPYKLIGKRFETFMLALIALNLLMFILETVDEFYEHHQLFFYEFEKFSVYIFTIEYVLRIWSITISEKYRHPITGRIRFALTPLAMIDLLAFLPFYLIFFGDLRFLRALRLFRLFRLFKLLRYSSALKMLVKIINAKLADLQIIFFTIFLLLLVSASIMYQVEHDTQPEGYSSIPQTMWWAVSALTTVGYGDVYPITPLGKFLGSFIALLGVGLFALPAGIISAGFMQEIEDERKEKQTFENIEKIKKAFYASPWKIGDTPASHRVLDLITIKSRMQFSEQEIFEAIKVDASVRIRFKKNAKEDRFANTLVIEHFEFDCAYGVYNNRQANITIISPMSYAEHSIGHFTAHLAKYANIDYMSNELYGENDDFNTDYAFSFTHNQAYVEGNSVDVPEAFQEFKDDLREVVGAEEKVFIIKINRENKAGFDIHFGAKKGTKGFAIENATTKDIEQLEDFYQALQKNFQEEDLKYRFTTHRYSDNTGADSLHQYIWKNTQAVQVVTIYINSDLIEWADDETYFKIIRILGDSLTEYFA